MLRSILCIVGAASALHIGEQPSVHDMIQGAIHAQTESKVHDGAVTVSHEGECNEACQRVAAELSQMEGPAIRHIIQAMNAGVEVSDELIQGILGGEVVNLAKEILEAGGLEQFKHTSLVQTDASHDTAASFLHKLH